MCLTFINNGDYDDDFYWWINDVCYHKYWAYTKKALNDKKYGDSACKSFFLIIFSPFFVNKLLLSVH